MSNLLRFFERQQHAFVIYSAHPYIWNSIELTLTATTVPYLPILASYFLTDGITILKVEPLPNLVGQLQCASKESAFGFSTCRFPPTTCHSTPLVYEASCYCPEGSVAKYLTITNYHSAKRMSSYYNAKTSSKPKQPPELAPRYKSQCTDYRSSQNAWTTNVRSKRALLRCYSCFQEAHVQMSCTSSLSEETGEIHCGDRDNLGYCPALQHTSPHHPAGQTTVTLQGNLVYVNEPIFQEASLQCLDVHHSTSSGFSIHDIPNVISNWFTSLLDVFKFWKSIFIVLVALVITLCIFRVLRRRYIYATLIKKSR